MKVTYLAAAGSEFEEATGYYNKERAGLGFEFADEVKPDSRTHQELP
jgi:hypothetical protein